MESATVRSNTQQGNCESYTYLWSARAWLYAELRAHDMRLKVHHKATTADLSQVSLGGEQ